MQLKLPQNWSQVRTEQFIEISELNEEDFGSLFLYNLEVLSIVSDTDIDDLEDLSPEELFKYMEQLRWMRKEPPKQPKQKVLNYTLLPMWLLTLGQFIDLEHYFADGYVKNLTTISAIRYKKSGVDEWENHTYEPYKYLPSDRAEEFNEVSISEIYGVIPEYIKFRDEFTKAYENLFEPTIEETDEELDPEDKIAEQEEQKVKKWSWENVIYQLADGDITKVDQITDLPLILAFNFLSMKYELKL